VAESGKRKMEGGRWRGGEKERATVGTKGDGIVSGDARVGCEIGGGGTGR